MAVTLEQAAVVIDELQHPAEGHERFTLEPNFTSKGNTDKLSKDGTPGKVARQLMRSHGVRREGVRCNKLKDDGGKGDRFAFNDVQRRFLPKELRPPKGSYCGGNS